MIRREELGAIAKIKGLGLRLAELDYLQDVALLIIYREFGGKLIFKGGTCLYKVYGLNRFSEDLDFTATKKFRPKDFFYRLPYFFSLLNIKSTVKVERFESGMNIFLRTMGPLYDGKKETAATITINISLRERVLLPPKIYTYAPLYSEIRPFDIFAMDDKEILAEKIRAVYERNKARDVYDVWYLLKVKDVNFDVGLVNKKLAIYKTKFKNERFFSKIEEKKSSWEKDLAGLVAGRLPGFHEVKKDIEKYVGVG
jgi:predicted nucleotidyltransferase component of viral defense system